MLSEMEDVSGVGAGCTQEMGSETLDCRLLKFMTSPPGPRFPDGRTPRTGPPDEPCAHACP